MLEMHNYMWDMSTQIPTIVAEICDPEELFEADEEVIEEDDITDISWLAGYKLEAEPLPESDDEEEPVVSKTVNDDSLSPIRPMSPLNPMFTSPLFRSGMMMKPPFTYTEILQVALFERGDMTVSEIYVWVSKHFPFYRINDATWKNSLRHKLCTSPIFHKKHKSLRGAGHMWSMSGMEEETILATKQRMEQYIMQNEYASQCLVKSQEDSESYYVELPNGYQYLEDVDLQDIPENI